MPRSWDEVFRLPEGRGAHPPAVEETEPERGGVLRRLRDNLSKSRRALAAELTATIGETLDAETWERLEEALILADVGARTTAEVVGRLEAEAESGEIEGPEQVRARLIELLAETGHKLGLVR
jgi:fused signal recognition particle receptor